MTELKEKIAGEITISESPGKIIKKWRKMFDVSQTDLADHMDVAPSVVSDYEKGRRKPGTPLVKKIVEALIGIDEERGGDVIKRFSKPGQHGIIDMEEYPTPINLSEIVEEIDGAIVTDDPAEREIYGYTIIDSIEAILAMKSFDYLSIYGWSTERVLFFDGVEYGRSPLVAIRSTPLTPAAVSYVKPKKIDGLSIEMAKREGIPLIKTDLDIEELNNKLKKWL